MRSLLPLLAPLVPTPRPLRMHARGVEFDLERTDIVVPSGTSTPMLVSLRSDGPVQVQLWARGSASSTWRCAAEAAIGAARHADGALETALDEIDLRADDDQVELRARPIGGGGARPSAPSVRQRVITEEKLGLVMELERELLFSGDRGGHESTQRRILAMVRASLLQKLRRPRSSGREPSGGEPSGAGSDELDSASLSFERMLARLRRSAGFAGSSPWHRIDDEQMPCARPPPARRRRLPAALARPRRATVTFRMTRS